MHHLHHPLRRRHKIRIEDRHQLPMRHLQPLIQRTRLIPIPIRPVQINNRLRLHPRKPRRIPLHNLARHRHRLIGRVIQHLYLKPVARIIQPAASLNQPLNHKLLIEDRQLHRNKRQLPLAIPRRRLIPLRRILLILEVQPNQLIPMNAIKTATRTSGSCGIVCLT